MTPLFGVEVGPGLPVYSLQRPPIHHPPFVFRRCATGRRMEITCCASRAAENKRL